jgi:hypothetical protein
MPCPLCGERCTCSAASGDSVATALLSPPARDLADHDYFSLNSAESNPRRITVTRTSVAEQLDQLQAPTPDWREQVASRLQQHRARRRRGKFDPDSSLSLGFEPLEYDVPANTVLVSEEGAVVTDFEADLYSQPVTNPLADEVAASAPPEPYRRIIVAPPDAQDNLIEFPRAAVLVETHVDELAEPIQPRILFDTPELDLSAPAIAVEAAPTKTLLASICLDSAATQPWEMEEETAIDLPLQVAGLSSRATCCAIDAVLVLTGSAIFTVIVMSIAKYMPQGKLALAFAALVPAIFGAVYQYIFLTYNGATPGMLMAQLELTSFEGCVPTAKMRSLRALSLLLSCASMGLGFAWALVDEDCLGWHDRITRTYLRQS